MSEPAMGGDMATMMMGGASRNVQVRIIPEQKIPTDLINRPARVVFELK
jgi:hypothetical protein